MKGVAKTLSQLRTLGLVSVIVVDCGPGSGPAVSHEQACRSLYFLHEFDNVSAVVLENVMAREEVAASEFSFPPTGPGIYVAEGEAILQTLQEDKIPVVTEYSYTASTKWQAERIPAEGIVVGLVRFFSGMQAKGSGDEESGWDWEGGGPRPLAAVETVVVLDPAGGIPVASNVSVPHRFVNLEAEYEPIVEHLEAELLAAESESKLADSSQQSPEPTAMTQAAAAATHLRNLKMVRDALLLLPPTASALITTPLVAANTARTPQKKTDLKPEPAGGIRNLHMPVGTRKTQNPLIHNLLTGKPVYSSSLPMEKVRRRDAKTEMATLVKRGMPVTIFPSTDLGPWQPPVPGQPRLRLTDTCMDLARLIYLIEDSFNRKLDVRDYLNRIHDNLAGVIIAGNYEGGAILTWESPLGLSEEEAYRTGRLVPYLDKFAVLKSRQGSGGVADIVFNAMVQECFPRGVCWRSRQNNPVNKWYFERSVGGTMRLHSTQWTMFWTTPGLVVGDQALVDYADVCRTIQPSWADNKHIVD
jgi:amino-acid N-acetyltransferase